MASGDCELDSECAGGEVCARDSQCAAPSEVYPVTLTWTVGGEPATAATCADAANLQVLFTTGNPYEDLAFSPVPCAIGQYFIDRLPRRYTAATVGSGNQLKSITSGSAAFDL